VSNKRKLKVADAGTVERCTSCTRRIGANVDALRLRTGQVICPRCRQYGGLERLSCGHTVLPGSFVVLNAGGDGKSRCPQCAPGDTAYAGNMRLGMAPRDG